jgi:polyphosphate kinase 2 (PPK2 family)
LGKWEYFARMLDLLIERTLSVHGPWTVVRSNDKRRARLAVMRRILSALPYAGRDLEAIGKQDEKIIGEGPDFLKEKE